MGHDNLKKVKASVVERLVPGASLPTKQVKSNSEKRDSSALNVLYECLEGKPFAFKQGTIMYMITGHMIFTLPRQAAHISKIFSLYQIQ